MNGSPLVKYIDNIVKLLHTSEYRRLSFIPRQKLTRLYKVLKDFLPEEKEPETSDLVYHCGLCNSVITMYNGDHQLSMDLHCQEDQHQQALQGKCQQSNEDDNMVIVYDGWNNMACAMCGTEVNDVPSHIRQKKHKQRMSSDLWLKHKSFFASPKPGQLQCVLCELYVYPGQTVHDHVVGKRHPKCVAKKFLRSRGVALHCILCNVTFQPDDRVMEHLDGKVHSWYVAKQQNMTWLTVPSQFRQHREYFNSHRDGVFQCTLCSAIVKDDAHCLVEHICGTRHSSHVANIGICATVTI